jgi:hypothetical protein
MVSGSEPSLTFTGDKSKLMSAPTFDQNNWPDISGPEWRHSIFSYYGVQPSPAIGGATGPGGASSGSSTPPDSSSPGNL